MKTANTLLVLIAALTIATGSASAAGFGVTFGVFYDGLSGHGEWIGVDGGTYAWRPMHVGPGWRPYFEGRWLWTDDGWYWDSDEPWAWATYHYGRWYYDDYYGWIWIPGYDWAPAWVEWRYGGDYVGWAPLGPYAVFSFHYGIHYLRHWVTPYHYWSFVDCRYVTHHNVQQYVYRRENNTRFIGRTRTAGSVRSDGNRIVSRGPEVSHVERRGNLRVERTEMVDVGGRDQARLRRTEGVEQIGVYRPRIEERRADLDGERPSVVRNQERMPSLDTRAMDIRQRQNAREEGRDVERMGSSRRMDAGSSVGRIERKRSSEDRVLPQSDNAPGERSAQIDRSRPTSRRSERSWNSPRQGTERRSTPGYERPERRSAPEMRSSPRSESSQSRPSAPRSGSTGGSGRSGSRESGGRDRR